MEPFMWRDKTDKKSKRYGRVLLVHALRHDDFKRYLILYQDHNALRIIGPLWLKTPVAMDIPTKGAFIFIVSLNKRVSNQLSNR